MFVYTDRFSGLHNIFLFIHIRLIPIALNTDLIIFHFFLKCKVRRMNLSSKSLEQMKVRFCINNPPKDRCCDHSVYTRRNLNWYAFGSLLSLVILCFSSQSRTVHSYGYVIYANFDLNSTLMASEQWVLSVPHLLWHWISIYVFIPEDP